MANWWEELEKNNSQQPKTLGEFAKTFKKEEAALSPSGVQAQPNSRAAAVNKDISLGLIPRFKADADSLELFSAPFRIGAEMSTMGGIVAQAVLRNPARYLGNVNSYKNLWKSAYKASVGDRTNKQWWQSGEDPVTIGQMYNALFNADAPDLLDKEAVNQYYETGDLFDKYGMPTPRWQSGSLDVLAMIFLDPLNAVGAGGVSKAAKGAELLSTGAKTVEHLTLKESIESGLRGSTGVGLLPDTERASQTVLADLLRQEGTGPITRTTNPLRRERIRNEIARFVSDVDYYDKVGLLDQSGNLLKYGDDDYLTAARILNEVFAPIEDVKFPDPSIFGIKDLLGERDFRYFVLDAETFATDGTAIMRWSYEKEKWMPALTFPKISIAKIMQNRMSLADNISNQIKSYDVGAEKTAVSPHVKEMILANLTDGPFGATQTGLLPPSTATEAYKVPDSVFTIPAVDPTGVKVPQPISAGARFSHVVIDGRKVYVLYDNQYDRFYTLQSYRTAKNINTGIEPQVKLEDIGDSTFDDLDVDVPVQDEITDNYLRQEDTTDFAVAEDELSDFGKDNLFTAEDAPKGARVTGVETKQRPSANRKLVWVRADWFDLARIESYEFKFVDGVTNRTRKVQVPARFKLINASEVSKGARPIFVEYTKKPGQFVPSATQYTVNRAGEIVPAAKAIAEDVAFKNKTADAAKLQADLQASIIAKMNDPAYINEMRQLHSSPYLAEQPRQPIDYSIWYEYKPNPDGTVNVTVMARRKEMSGFDDWAEEVSTKDFVLHTWENVPQQAIKRYTYEGFSMYGNRGGTVSPLDERIDQTGKTLWERTIGNAEEPAVSFNVDDIYRFGYSRPYESRVAKPYPQKRYTKNEKGKPELDGEETLEDARLEAFRKEKNYIIAKRSGAIKQLEYIQKQYPDWEDALAEATRLETRWREVDKELKVLKSIQLEVSNKNAIARYENRQELIAKLEKEKQSIEETLTSTEHTALLNSTKIKYAMRAKSIRLYLKHLDEIAPYYVDVNHYLLGYSKGIITRGGDVKRTEQWLLNFEDFLNNSLGTKFSAQKALEDLAAKEEVIVPQYYIPERVEEFVVDAETKRIADEAVARGEAKGKGETVVEPTTTTVPNASGNPELAGEQFVDSLYDEFTSRHSGKTDYSVAPGAGKPSQLFKTIIKERTQKVFDSLQASNKIDSNFSSEDFFKELENYSDTGMLDEVFEKDLSDIVRLYNEEYFKLYHGLNPDDTIRFYRGQKRENLKTGYWTMDKSMAVRFGNEDIFVADIKISDIFTPVNYTGFKDEFAIAVKNPMTLKNLRRLSAQDYNAIKKGNLGDRDIFEIQTNRNLNYRNSVKYRFDFKEVKKPTNARSWLTDEEVQEVNKILGKHTYLKGQQTNSNQFIEVSKGEDGVERWNINIELLYKLNNDVWINAVSTLQNLLRIKFIELKPGKSAFDFEKKILGIGKDS